MIGHRLKKIKQRLIGGFYKLKTGYRYIPTFAVIELTKHCNAKCSFCPREYIDEHGDMPIETFKEIVDAMPFVTEILPQGVGEPLLYPNLIEAIKYAKKKRKRVLFYTNASLLDETMALALLESELDEIRFSVDAMDEDTYLKMRGKLSWDKVLSNILKFQELKDSGGYKTKTVVRMVKNRVNQDSIDEIKTFWESRVDEVGIQNEVSLLLPTDELWVEADGPKECPRIDSEVVIDFKGRILFCCEDWFSQYPVADISEGILSVFNSSKMNSVRGAMKLGYRIPALCEKCEKMRSL